jgi:hypothetical protein
LPQQHVFEQARTLLQRGRLRQAVAQIRDRLPAPECIQGEVGILKQARWWGEEGIDTTGFEIDPYLEEMTIRFERKGTGIWAVEQRWEAITKPIASDAAGEMWRVGQVAKIGHTEPVAAQINNELRRAGGQDARARMPDAEVDPQGGHKRGEQRTRGKEAV